MVWGSDVMKLRLLPRRAVESNSSARRGRSRSFITSLPGMDDNGKPAVGYVKVGYFEGSGYWEDTIKMQVDVTGVPPNEVYEKSRQKTLGVAIGRLGAEGWEMVGELPFTKRYSS